MFKNYLKITFRNFSRNKLFSFINVFGLAIGFFACMMIYLWVQQETSYDSIHNNAGRIYRIERELFRENLYSRWPITSGAYKQALVSDYPEIENAVRFWRREFSITDDKGFVHRQELFAVDNAIFDVFSFSLEEGDEKTALKEPMTVALNREKALSYFGTDDVIGKSLTFEWDGAPVDFKVTGILKKIPVNSHIHFDMLISISSYPDDRFADWRSNYLYTYVLVKENTSKADLEEKLETFVNQRLKPYYGDLTGGGADIHDVLKIELFPITDIHLHPRVNWEIEAGGNVLSVYIFSSIAVLILIIACLNFINLSTARAKKRAKEVSLRKTIGANKNQLKFQFIQESVLVAVVALFIAVAITDLFIPVFNHLFDENLSANLLFQAHNIKNFLGITFIIGFLAGLYPAFYLTKFEPAAVLKGNLQSGTGKSVFRQNMVVIQFVISITLIICLFTIHKQMNFIQNRNIGFDKENVVLIPARSRQVVQNYMAFRSELMRGTDIISVAASADVPSDRIYGNTNYADNRDHNNSYSMTNIFIDYDFVETYRMEILAGRNFSRDFGSDSAGTILLNESAVQKFGWTPEEAVGKELAHRNRQTGKIVGVVKNFNFKTVHTEIEPVVMLLVPDYITTVSVRIMPGDVGKTIDFIQQKWENTFLEEQFEYSFLDNRINQLYAREKKMQNIFLMFSFLSLFVACLGLFGLAAFTIKERTKEIGIRKVLGASIPGIFSLLLREFVKWVIIGTVISWPVAWFAMTKWLQNFAYRTELGWWIFALAGGLALLIAIATVSFQAIKAALSNPVKALRYE